jgi:outer membrane lipoprotein SlyB
VGAAAGAGVAGVTGDRNIKVEEVLIGAGVGALAGTLFGREQATVFEINPNTGLTVTLTSDLLLQ